MTASGPFAMGPALAGMASARRTAPRQAYTPVMPQGPGATQKLGAGLTQTTAPSLGVKREPGEAGSSGKGKEKQKVEEDDDEVYSDPDEGVEILDMEKIRTMDWMAPEVLRKEKKPLKKVKEEKDVKGKGVAREKSSSLDEDEEADSKVNLANAVHLSDSEEEEEMEDIVDDFAIMDSGSGLLPEQLFFFQFPSPLPTFLSKSTKALTSVNAGHESPADARSAKQEATASKATPAASGTATPAAAAAAKDAAPEEEKVDGTVGQLEIYRSGAVKMRIGKDIVLDVTPGTQPSFLQHAVYVDPVTKRLCVLGDVHRRLTVTPDLDALLHSLDAAEHPAGEVGAGLDMDGLISMDTS